MTDSMGNISGPRETSDLHFGDRVKVPPGTNPNETSIEEEDLFISYSSINTAPEEPLTRKQVIQYLKDLGNEDSNIRDTASEKLQANLQRLQGLQSDDDLVNFINMLTPLAESEDAEVKRRIKDILKTLPLKQTIKLALNENISPETIKYLSLDSRRGVITALLCNKKTSSDVIKGILNGLDESFIRAIATCTMLSPATFEELSKHKSNLVIAVIAGNPSIPDKIFKALLDAKDIDDFIKVGLAKNPKMSPEKLDEFARTDSLSLKAAVAENPSTSNATLENLLEDKDELVVMFVRPSVERTLRIRAGKPENKELDPFDKLDLAKNKKTPPAILEELLGDENLYVFISAFETLFAKK